MAVDFKKLDSRTLSQLCQDLQGETAQSAEGVLLEVAHRLHIPVPRFMFNVEPYGTDLGPSYRPEWSQLVRTGKAFSVAFTSPAVAANLSQAQLFNPAGSGVILLVAKAFAFPGAAADIIFTKDNAAAATDDGVAQNLLFSGAANSLGHARHAAAAAVAGLGTLQRVNNGANTSVMELASSALLCELAEGFGVSAWCNLANTNLFATFVWAEVDANYPR